MNLEQQKERALTFLKNFEKPDPKAFADLISDDFEFEMMGRLPVSRRCEARMRF